MPREDSGLAQLLEALNSPAWEKAWEELIERVAPLLLAVAREFEQDPERLDDCFVYVCERLREHHCRRLRRFHPEGPARFTTWLRTVVRNLCIDWRRRRVGRHRLLRSITDLSVRDQEIYRHLYEQGCTIGETLHSLRLLYPDLDRNAVAMAAERIAARLTPRQFWILSLRRPRFEQLGEHPEPGPVPAESLAEAAPGPEEVASLREQRRLLSRALSRLSSAERLLVRLRFEQGLSLEQISRMMNLGNAQRVDRRLRKVLRRLRTELDP